MSALSDLFAWLGIWSWFVVAAILFMLELVVPGVHFIWFGFSAAIVGGLTMLTGMAWPIQILAFVGISIVAVLTVRRFAEPDLSKSDQPDLNVRGHQYVGRVLVVEDAISGGRGKVRVGDTLWSAEGPDAAKGSHVRVKSVNGTVLVVEGT